MIIQWADLLAQDRMRIDACAKLLGWNSRRRPRWFARPWTPTSARRVSGCGMSGRGSCYNGVALSARAAGLRHDALPRHSLPRTERPSTYRRATMPGTLKVANWREWQSYRSDRGQPPWIKVHRRLLRNPEWVQLSDAARAHLVSIWILAADKDGEIPDSPELIQRFCCLDSPPDLDKLASLGFLLPAKKRRGDAKVTPTRRQGDAPEAEAEEIREEAEAKADTRAQDAPSFDFERIKNAYPKRAGSQPWKRAISAANARIKDGADFEDIIAGVERYAAYCQATDKTNTELVMHAATFLGPDEHFRNEWTAPKKPETKAEAYLRRTRDFEERYENGRQTGGATVSADGVDLRPAVDVPT